MSANDYDISSLSGVLDARAAEQATADRHKQRLDESEKRIAALDKIADGMRELHSVDETHVSEPLFGTQTLSGPIRPESVNHEQAALGLAANLKLGTTAHYLAQHLKNEWVTVRDMLEAIEAAGWTSTATEPIRVVRTTLNELAKNHPSAVERRIVGEQGIQVTTYRLREAQNATTGMGSDDMSEELH